eukprot:scaffold7328_cov314-Pinguiococcus_pyrenoidosus.AAC.66
MTLTVDMLRSLSRSGYAEEQPLRGMRKPSFSRFPRPDLKPSCSRSDLSQVLEKRRFPGSRVVQLLGGGDEETAPRRVGGSAAQFELAPRDLQQRVEPRCRTPCSGTRS